MLAGTAVMEGSGRMLVLAVGVRSQAGVVAALLGATEAGVDVTESTVSVTSSSDAVTISTDSTNSTMGSKPANNAMKNRSILQEKLQVLATQIGKIGKKRRYSLF